MLETGFGQIMILIGGTTLIVTALALLSPVCGVHKKIRSVPEWPFTTSTDTRLILYALIPAASCSFGIVAEGLVGRALS